MSNSRRRHSPEQVVRKLGQPDRPLGEGAAVAAVCRELGVSEHTYYRWRNQYGGLKGEDVKRLKELDAERDAQADAEMVCRLVGLSRSACRRPLKADAMADPDRALRDRLRAYAKKHPR